MKNRTEGTDGSAQAISPDRVLSSLDTFCSAVVNDLVDKAAVGAFRFRACRDSLIGALRMRAEDRNEDEDTWRDVSKERDNFANARKTARAAYLRWVEFVLSNRGTVLHQLAILRANTSPGLCADMCADVGAAFAELGRLSRQRADEMCSISPNEPKVKGVPSSKRFGQIVAASMTIVSLIREGILDLQAQEARARHRELN